MHVPIIKPLFVPQAPTHHQLQFRDNERCFPACCDQAGAEWRVDFWCACISALPWFVVVSESHNPRVEADFGNPVFNYARILAG